MVPEFMELRLGRPRNEGSTCRERTKRSEKTKKQVVLSQPIQERFWEGGRKLVKGVKAEEEEKKSCFGSGGNQGPALGKEKISMERGSKKRRDHRRQKKVSGTEQQPAI